MAYVARKAGRYCCGCEIMKLRKDVTSDFYHTDEEIY